jgi:hypothetical protein
VNAQKFRGLRNVSVAIGEHTLDVFPFNSGKRRHRSRRVFFGGIRAQLSIGIENLFSVSRLCKVVICAEFQSLHCRRNASITREHHDGDRRINLLDSLNQIQSAEIGHLQVEQHEVGADAFRELQALLLRAGFMSLATAVAKRATQTASEYLVVIDNHDYRALRRQWSRRRHASCSGVRVLPNIHVQVRIRKTAVHREFARTSAPETLRAPCLAPPFSW